MSLESHGQGIGMRAAERKLSVMSGKWMWIWDVQRTLHGDVSAWIEIAHRLGLRGYIVKSHDGIDVWEKFGKICRTLRDANLGVASWGYVYGSDPLREANAAQVGIDEGSDFYVMDAEEEFEGSRGYHAAHQLGERLRVRNPYAVLGYAPFALCEEHPGYPYRVFSTYCDIVLPQVYWGDMNRPVVDVVRETYRGLRAYGLAVLPIGQSYGNVTIAQIQTFASLVCRYGSRGISFWDLQSASDAQQHAIGEIAFPCTPPVHSDSGSSSTLLDGVKDASRSFD